MVRRGRARRGNARQGFFSENRYKMQRYKIIIVVETDADPSSLLDTAIDELAPIIENYIDEDVGINYEDITVQRVDNG